jgi:hypothetical protein
MPEKCLSLADAVKVTPGRPSIPTLWRWCRIGLRGVRLPYLRFGRRIMVERSAIDDFARRLAGADAPPPSVGRREQRQKAETAQRRRAERSEQALDAAGV